MRGYHHSAASRMVQIARATDDLSGITALTNGYWWHARNATGIGTAAFKVPEGNLHTAFDLIQATVANQPTVLTENGGVQFRMRKQVDANPSRIAAAAPVQAGWTGATYVAGWFRLPDASGDVTGSDQMFVHNLPTGNQRRITIFSGTSPSDIISMTLCELGTSTTSRNAVANPLAGGNWHWLEWAFDPLLTLGGSVTADRNKSFSDLVLQERVVTETGAVVPTSIFNASAAPGVACIASTISNADTTDWAACYYCNGIPSIGDRRRMAGYYPPRTITF